MPEITLVVGNKAYSSWSLRAWLALVRTGAPFHEIVVPLDRPETAAALAAHSPSGLVPVLKTDDLVLWESLAILEYLADRFPDAKLWPEDGKARAYARCVAAEMHAGFTALRQGMPMDLKQRYPDVGRTPAVLADIDRIVSLWRDCRRRYGGNGAFLFGGFTNADAMFAPVATRLVTYEVPLPADAQEYVDAIMGLPEMMTWAAAAKAEPWVITHGFDAA